jgi:hypothetical protein
MTKKHGNHRHGHHQSRTYRSWNMMIQRCCNPRVEAYAQYGGRGITVCPAWRSDFAAFLSDMGERPLGTSLDRIDGGGNYEPGNCRWATASEQACNRRSTKIEPHEPEQMHHLALDGYTHGAIGSFFGITHSHASKLIRAFRGRMATI